MTILKYENQAYSLQILEPDYYDWVFFPGDFIPYEIWFDAQGPSGQQDGTFGVFCQFQDEENYTYAEFDLADNSYLIGQILDGDDIPLTEENESGQYWQSASELKSPPTSVNRIGVSCYLDSISLFINDQWVDEVSVSHPFDQPGKRLSMCTHLILQVKTAIRCFLIMWRSGSRCSEAAGRVKT